MRVLQEWAREEIDKGLQGNNILFLYLYTPLCGTCQLAEKMLTVAAAHMSEYTFSKANLNYISDIAEKWEVESVPCLVIIIEGKVIDKVYAFHSVPHIVSKIKKII